MWVVNILLHGQGIPKLKKKTLNLMWLSVVKRYLLSSVFFGLADLYGEVCRPDQAGLMNTSSKSGTHEEKCNKWSKNGQLE